LQKAAEQALPGWKEQIVIEVAQQGEHDYQCPSAMRIYNKYLKQGAFGHATNKALADAILSKVPADAKKLVKKFELSKIGKDEDEAKARYYINIFLSQDYLQSGINNIASQKEIKVEKVNKKEESK
jgi:arginyl-tRNA synthetase